eukprot:jgi/Mesvir1/13076/Mv06062-RA.1
MAIRLVGTTGGQQDIQVGLVMGHILNIVMPIYGEENIGPHAVRKEAQEGPVIPMLREDDLATGPVQKATGKEAKERLYRDQAKARRRRRWYRIRGRIPVGKNRSTRGSTLDGHNRMCRTSRERHRRTHCRDPNVSR